MQDKHSRSRSLFLDSLSLFFPWKNYYYYYYYHHTVRRLILCPCTVLLKKIIWLGLRTKSKEKAPKNRGDATFIPHFPSRDMERKPGGAGGGKRPYEATFWIAMKIGRKYSSTAAECSLELEHIFSVKTVAPQSGAEHLLLKYILNFSLGLCGLILLNDF